MRGEPTGKQASSKGRWVNSGNGMSLLPIDIGHDDYLAVVSPDTAFWALVGKQELAEVFSSGHPLCQEYRQKAAEFE